MNTPRERWLKVWRTERKRLYTLGLDHHGVSVNVNGRDLWFQHTRWNKIFAPIDAHMSRAVSEHANVHQFLTDIETGVDELDVAHVEMVRGARLASVKEGFRLP